MGNPKYITQLLIIYLSNSPVIFPLQARQHPFGTRPPQCQGFTITDTPQSVGLLFTSDQPDTETSTRQNTTLIKIRERYMLRAEFEPIIPAREGPQTDALDCATTGIICYSNNISIFQLLSSKLCFVLSFLYPVRSESC
jgi:hypothetical protein